MKKVQKIILGILACVLFSSSANAAFIIGCGVVSDYDSAYSCEENKTHTQRKSVLSQYSQFFNEVGANLSIETSEYEYKKWLKELIEAKVDYEEEQKADREHEEELTKEEEAEIIRKEQELNERILELENKVNELESQKITSNKKSESAYVKPVMREIVTQKNEVVILEEDKIQLTKQESVVIPEPILMDSQDTGTVLPKKISWFKKIINWFRLK
ncbi:hypothetical protein [Aequorivita vladivostokensis]|uniref:Lipoprotein n=1 Tax=Aequorivita vladivostokensis TaxID=171194 RepID=A0ABR5DM56_9FLAO|nr:hypothetical protein [Aequorivita vladivostokensis]KJJ39866.1 hypothetical protein MB09_01465 [Aequorivita vladivostokensis]